MTPSTRTVNVEDVTQQSKERLNDRVAAVEALAVAHNERIAGEADAQRRRDELEAELAELTGLLEREHKERYDAAVKSGWTARDLRAMGLDLPNKPATKRRRRKPAAKQSASTATMAEQQHASAESAGDRDGESAVGSAA